MDDLSPGTGDPGLTAANAAMVDEALEADRRVTSLELFFDLVFVFAITQVTTLMAHDPTALGLLRGMTVLVALWWAWVGYSWIGTVADPEDGATRFVFLAAMVAMMVTALAAPGAFEGTGLLFGAAYLAVRVMQVVLLVTSGRSDVGVASAARRLSPPLLLGSSLILVAGFVDAGPVRASLWAVALLVDIGAPVVVGTRGWKVSPGHFAERHGLVVIIALGEALVSIGAAVSGRDLDLGTVGVVSLGVVLSAALWWMYFDVVAPVAEGVLRRVDRETRARIARDSYSYLHFPMLAGIVLLALGLKKALGDVTAPLSVVGAVALCGGPALYLLGHLGFRLRNIGSLNRQRLALTLFCLVLMGAGVVIPAWVTLALLTAAFCGTVAFEVVAFREWRTQVRRGDHGSPGGNLAGGPSAQATT